MISPRLFVAVEPQLEMLAHVPPLGREGAVNHRVANGPVATHAIVADDTVPLRADAFDRALRPDIEVVRAEPNDLASHRVEGVLQQEQLARRVHIAAPAALRIPRIADLDAVDGREYVVVARASHN